jgi:Kef-type K+ transport system membrane component KefB
LSDAGAEVDVPQFRRELKASLSIGLVSFLAPFAVVGLLVVAIEGPLPAYAATVGEVDESKQVPASVV